MRPEKSKQQAYLFPFSLYLGAIASAVSKNSFAKIDAIYCCEQ